MRGSSIERCRGIGPGAWKGSRRSRPPDWVHTNRSVRTAFSEPICSGQQDGEVRHKEAAPFIELGGIRIIDLASVTESVDAKFK